MSYDPTPRFGKSCNDAALQLAKRLQQLCNPPKDSGLERLTVLRERLLTLFLKLQNGEVSSSDAREQSLQMQEELSELIFTVDDWQMQSQARN